MFWFQSFGKKKELKFCYDCLLRAQLEKKTDTAKCVCFLGIGKICANQNNLLMFVFEVRMKIKKNKTFDFFYFFSPYVEATLNVTNVALLANISFHYHLPILSMTLARPSADALTIGIPELACVISVVMLSSCYHCDNFVSTYC